MYGYVYKLTNLITHKVYVGKHKYSFPKLDENYKSSKGQKPTEYSIQRSIETHKGSRWWNNGKEEHMFIGDPPEGYVRGRLTNPFKKSV